MLEKTTISFKLFAFIILNLPQFSDGESVKLNNTVVDSFHLVFTHTEFKVNGEQVKAFENMIITVTVIKYTNTKKKYKI